MIVMWLYVPNSEKKLLATLLFQTTTYTRRGHGNCTSPGCSFTYVTRHKPPKCPKCGNFLGGKWIPKVPFHTSHNFLLFPMTESQLESDTCVNTCETPKSVCWAGQRPEEANLCTFPPVFLQEQVTSERVRLVFCHRALFWISCAEDATHVVIMNKRDNLVKPDP